MELQPYLIFPGTCEEALQFYVTCFDGEIVLLTRYSESPLDVPEEAGNRVFNSAFQAGGVRFRASDNLPSHSVVAGTNFSLFVAFQGREAQARVLASLADGGRILMPLTKGFAMVQDRFGIRWMLALEEEVPG